MAEGGGLCARPAPSDAPCLSAVMGMEGGILPEMGEEAELRCPEALSGEREGVVETEARAA